MGGFVRKWTGADKARKQAARQQDIALKEQRRQAAESRKLQDQQLALQKEQLESQKAIQQRSLQIENDRRDDLQRDQSTQLRAIAARRRGRAALAFSGPTTGLKSTLGG